VGDSVLKTIAQRLMSTTRTDDTVSRVGGDEFIYLLMEVRDETRIAIIAEKIIKSLQAPMSIRVRDLCIDLRIRASVGIAISPKDGSTVDTLVSNADAAMYQAKRSRSGYSFVR
jgi:diguanylate cyclase (GGDEF)-like protein